MEIDHSYQEPEFRQAPVVTQISVVEHGVHETVLLANGPRVFAPGCVILKDGGTLATWFLEPYRKLDTEGQNLTIERYSNIESGFLRCLDVTAAWMAANGIEEMPDIIDLSITNVYEDVSLQHANGNELTSTQTYDTKRGLQYLDIMGVNVSIDTIVSLKQG